MRTARNEFRRACCLPLIGFESYQPIGIVQNSNMTVNIVARKADGGRDAIDSLR